MITSFDRQNLKVVRQALDEAFDKIRKDLGINLRVGNIRFDANTFSTKIQASTLKHIQGSVETLGDVPPLFGTKYDSLSTLSRIHGYNEKVLSDADVNKEFKLQYQKNVYVILGASIRSHKFPVIAKDKRTGKEFKFRISDVAEGLGRKFKVSAMDQAVLDEAECRAEGRAEAMAS
jgi:hypothetical protein